MNTYRLLFLFFSLILTGCASYRIPTAHFAQHSNRELSPVEQENKEIALDHWLYCMVPRHRCQIQWFDVGHWCTWALFGNDDDGIFGEEAGYRSCRYTNGVKALAWGVRNPLHNFTFYVIGSAYCHNSSLTLLELSPQCFSLLYYTPEEGHTFASRDTSLYLALHGWKPFISLRLAYADERSADFYLGWRERGNFGAKCHPLAKRKPLKNCTTHTF